MRKLKSPAAKSGAAKRTRAESRAASALPPPPSAEAPRVELRLAASLVPYARNARKHSDAHVHEVAAAIVEFGWTNPILADDVIRAGHARQKAALLIYGQGKTIRLPSGAELPKGFVPVIDCTGWTDAQKRAYVLADNKLTENADWDTELLKVELEELKVADFNLAAIGFGKGELKALFGDGDEDDAGAGFEIEPQYQILIECRDEAHQVELLTKLDGDGITCRALVA
ncbi:MAG: DNA methylase [Alphaproteobacteria bacterium]|nr:MAG: DNA methylase [Alphaproteobacteria bacterium]